MKDLLQNARAVEARLRKPIHQASEQATDTIAALCTALEAAQKDAERLKTALKYSADTAFETLAKPTAGYYRGLKLIMDAAIKAQGDTK